MMKYQEWEKDTLEKMHMQVLKKAGCIMKHSGDGEDLDSSDLDNLCHCTNILDKIHHLMAEHQPATK